MMVHIGHYGNSHLINHDNGMTKRKNMIGSLAIMTILTSMNHDKGMTKSVLQRLFFAALQ
jgi:hypothetical protein